MKFIEDEIYVVLFSMTEAEAFAIYMPMTVTCRNNTTVSQFIHLLATKSLEIILEDKTMQPLSRVMSAI